MEIQSSDGCAEFLDFSLWLGFVVSHDWPCLLQLMYKWREWLGTMPHMLEGWWETDLKMKAKKIEEKHKNGKDAEWL